MKILVIGGAGFIGSHLCELYANHHEVTSLDNYISGKKDNHVAGVEYLEMNSEDILTLKSEYNLIFHLGEYSRVEQSLSKIDYVLSNNLSPILNILKFFRFSNKLSFEILCLCKKYLSCLITILLYGLNSLLIKSMKSVA